MPDTITLSLLFEYRNEDGTLKETKRFDLEPDTAIAYAGMMSSVGRREDEGKLCFCLFDVLQRGIENFTIPCEPIDVPTVIEKTKR